MTEMSNDSKERGLLPFDVIVAANAGDPEAMLKVIKHYESFMLYQARRLFVKPNGESMHNPEKRNGCSASSVRRSALAER